MKGLSRGIAALALACAAMVMAGVARAADDDYPNHPVRWLVGYPPGGSTDICARLIGQYLSEHLHQQFAVEKQARRRLQPRHRNRRPCAGRWLHRVPGQPRQCHQCQSL
jgi:hypothetical protein